MCESATTTNGRVFVYKYAFIVAIILLGLFLMQTGGIVGKHLFNCKSKSLFCLQEK